MPSTDIVADGLSRIVTTQDASGSSETAESWAKQGVGAEAIEPILRCMEDNPEIDFGTPGALVHFIEGFHGPSYVVALLASLERRPTSHTVWMLNRVINGTRDQKEREKLLEAMHNAGRHPRVDAETRDSIAHFLSFQEGR